METLSAVMPSSVVIQLGKTTDEGITAENVFVKIQLL